MRIISLIILLVLSSVSYADSATTSTLTIQPSPADQSIQYLGSLFGTVGNVLHGNGSPVIAALFHEFNFAVLLLAMIVITYTLVVGTLNTANDGEMMGKKWSSIWVPMRTAMGIALMLPKASGYAVLQIFIMWVVVQGVGAADAVWGTAIHALEKGGSFAPSHYDSYRSVAQYDFKKPLNGNKEQGIALISQSMNLWNPAQNLLEAQVCVDVANQVYGPSGGSFNCSVQNLGPSPDSNAPEYAIQCGGQLNSSNGSTVDYSNICGTVTPNFSSIQNNYPNQDGVSNSDIYNAEGSALNQMITAEAPAAQAIANYPVGDLSGNNPPPLTVQPGAVTNGVNVYQSIMSVAVASYQNQLLSKSNWSRNTCMTPYQFMQKIEPYYKKIAPIKYPNYNQYPFNDWNNMSKASQMLIFYKGQYGDNPTNWNRYTKYLHSGVCRAPTHGPTGVTRLKNNLNDALNNGWFDAGRYYLGIAHASYRQSSYELPALDYTAPNVTDGSDPSSGSITLPNWSLYQNIITDYSQDDKDAYYNSASMPWWIHQQQIPITDDGEKYIAEGINSALKDWGELFYSIGHDSRDPIIAVQRFGKQLVHDGIQAYTQQGAYFADKHYEEWWKALIGNMYGDKNINKMISAMWYLPIGIAVITIMLSSGLMMEVYIPLVPFILFTLGGIGWLIGVIEGMLAAPIVCFGIIHPNSQNDFVGKAEPAVMLIINMFLRPTLMVMGMLMGIGLMFVATAIFTNGFSVVVTNLMTYMFGMRSVLTAALLVGIYAFTLTLLMNKSFALIYIIPDKILRWIQGGDVTRDQFGELGAQAEQQIRGAADQGAKDVSQGLGQSAEKYDSTQLQLAQQDQKMVGGMFQGL